MILAHPLVDGTVSLAALDESAARGAYQSWMRDEAVLRFLEARFAALDADALAAFIGAQTRSPTSLLAGIFFEGQHVGNIKLEIVPEHGRGSLGILIGETSVWGQGIARRAITLMSDHAFSALDIKKLSAGCYATNIGSRKAFEAAGYIRDGVLRGHYVDGC